jgi:hypothetical protein
MTWEIAWWKLESILWDIMERKYPSSGYPRMSTHETNSLSSTEMGQLMTSFRPAEDKAWNYVRPLPKVEPYIHMAPRGPNIFECVVLDGLLVIYSAPTLRSAMLGNILAVSMTASLL